MAKIAILYPTDPAGYVPSGIDSVIRGIIKYAPADLDYTLFGATSDAKARPVGNESRIELGGRAIKFFPLVVVDKSARRGLMPLTVRYMHALRRTLKEPSFTTYDIIDFHRIEPVLLLKGDQRPKNIIMHQDMSVIRDKNCDIMWRHAPWLYEKLERAIFRSANRIFAVRKNAVERYKTLYPELADRFSFIPTWVDTAIFRPSGRPEDRLQSRQAVRSKIGVSPEARLLVFVGRLDRQKDPLLLMKAFREVRRRESNAVLLIIGDGQLRSDVESASVEMGLTESVRLLGAKSAADIAEILQVSDVFVLSSAYEGMPIAVLEALATGVPVVSTNVGEVASVVRDGISGYISSERSADALAHAISMALQNLKIMTGKPCESAVSPYHPERVLGAIYENHRRQSRMGLP